MLQNSQRVRIYAWFVCGFAMPPPLWLFICWFSGLWDTQTLIEITSSPLLAAYVASYITCAVVLLRRALVVIDAPPGGNETDGDARRAAMIARLPLLYICAEGLYCVIGPNTGLVAHRFASSKDYLLSWIAAVPIILAYSVPFLFRVTECVEQCTAHIPLPQSRPARGRRTGE